MPFSRALAARLRQPQAVGVGGADRDDLVDRTRSGREVAFDLQDRVGRIVGIRRAEDLNVLHVGAGGAGRKLVDLGLSAVGPQSAACAPRPSKVFCGEPVPFDGRVKGIVAVRVAGANRVLAAQGVVGSADQAGPPFCTGVKPDLADDVNYGRSFAQHYRIVAVEPSSVPLLIGRCQDGRIGRVGWRNDIHVAIGNCAGQVDGQSVMYRR